MSILSFGLLGARVRDPRSVAYLVLAVLAAWLFAAVVLVDIDYYDGFSAICNAKHFLGHGTYIFDRGPLMAWLVMPAEVLKAWLAPSPLNVRPHHIVTGLLHLGYLLGTYQALVRVFGHRWSTLVAFVAAVPTFLFFAYAPFVSHDIAPGLLLIWMVIWSEDFRASPRLRLWLALVAAGAAAALVKQTYGVFWIAVLVAHGVDAFRFSSASQDRDRPVRRAFWLLASGAATSGAIVWVVYSVVLREWAPDVSFWLRPYRNLLYLAHVYDGTSVQMPWWIYVRNLWASGLVTMLAIIPGFVLSARASALQRRAMIVWIAAAFFIQAMPLREVRYIAFLAPLSALLIVPAIRDLARVRLARVAIAGLLLLDLSNGASEAARIGTKFYRDSTARQLLAPLASADTDGPLLYSASMLSFVAPGQSPLAADRYHGVFHLGISHIARLFNFHEDRLFAVTEETQGRAATSRVPDGTPLLFSNRILAYGPGWEVAPPPGTETFLQAVATAEVVVASRRADGTYGVADGRLITLEDPGTSVVTAGPVLRGTGIPPVGRGELLSVAIFLPAQVAYSVGRLADGAMTLNGVDVRSWKRPQTLRLQRFAVQRLMAGR